MIPTCARGTVVALAFLCRRGSTAVEARSALWIGTIWDTTQETDLLSEQEVSRIVPLSQHSRLPQAPDHLNGRSLTRGVGPQTPSGIGTQK